MLGGDVTDLVEAHSLSFRPHHIDIYLASWGPEDDGATLGGPGPLTQLALQNGVKTVRKRQTNKQTTKRLPGVARGGICVCSNVWAKIFTWKYHE